MSAREPVCFIVSAGDAVPEKTCRADGDLVIAADAGYLSAHLFGLEPDIVIGDLDSLGYVPQGVKVISCPPEKDVTDTMMAVQEGMSRGFRDFIFYGALGGRRPDHAIANIEILTYLAAEGCRGRIFGSGTEITAFRNGTLSFPAGKKGYISVFTLGSPAHGVTETGLKYRLDDAVISTESPFPQCVSNEFTGREASITVREGILTVIWFDRELF